MEERTWSSSEWATEGNSDLLLDDEIVEKKEKKDYDLPSSLFFSEVTGVGSTGLSKTPVAVQASSVCTACQNSEANAFPSQRR